MIIINISITTFILYYCNASISILGTPITCSTWPTSETFGCKDDDNGSWKLLDVSLDVSQTSQKACEQLCLLEGEEGCCWLGGAGLGCYWKVGSVAAGGEKYSWLAVSCSRSGTL